MFIKKKTDTKIKLYKKDRVMCAFFRPGHFEGVLAVINQFLKKLDVSYIFFGEKDYQQLFLISKFIKNKFNVKVVKCKTIRDLNKVALSSRNILLNKMNLKKASKISKLLINFKKKAKNINQIEIEIRNLKKKINLIKGIKLEYLEVRNMSNLSKLYNLKNLKIFIAYYIKNIRLIDNF